MFKSLIAGTALTGNDYEFMKFVSRYGKSYGTVAEFQFRQEIFLARHAEIEDFNAGNNTHVVGHNEFSDMTKDEFKKKLGYKGKAKKPTLETVEADDSLPKEIDWREKGGVTAVKNQGQCGSCWAFSTTGAVEGAYFIKHGVLKSFSEQQLVDCSHKGNSGCNGGLMDYAFEYIKTHPLELESDYDYTGVDSGTCKYVDDKGKATVATFEDILPNTNALKTSIVAGPTSVAIEADQMVFQAYQSGVITDGCGTEIDHGVLAVGYGTLDGQDYFLVKNSWGPAWGDKGYVRIGTNNACGILTAASRPSE